ncbi:MAG TPA: hypothetical protein VGC88_11355, partial [Terriglobales bacterium]
PAPPALTEVDSGTFTVSVQGSPVARETFRIEQGPGNSITHSELRLAGNTGKPNQTATLQLTATGELIRYDWENPEGHSTVSVEPKDEFIVETLAYPYAQADKSNKTNVIQRQQALPHMLPRATPVMDDNFFSHREVLLWRYMASQCGKKNAADSGVTCSFEKQTYGVLVPNQHEGSTVTIEYVGQAATTVNAQPRIADEFAMVVDEMPWKIFIDPKSMKVMRMEIPSQGTVITRD